MQCEAWAVARGQGGTGAQAFGAKEVEEALRPSPPHQSLSPTHWHKNNSHSPASCPNTHTHTQYPPPPNYHSPERERRESLREGRQRGEGKIKNRREAEVAIGNPSVSNLKVCIHRFHSSGPSSTTGSPPPPPPPIRNTPGRQVFSLAMGQVGAGMPASHGLKGGRA